MYNTFTHFTTLYNNFYKQTCNIVQNLYTTSHNSTTLYTTSQIFTQFDTIPQNSSQALHNFKTSSLILQTLQTSLSQKLLHIITQHKKNSAILYIHNYTTQNSKSFQTIQHFTILHETVHILTNSTQLYSTLQHFTNIVQNKLFSTTFTILYTTCKIKYTTLQQIAKTVQNFKTL